MSVPLQTEPRGRRMDPVSGPMLALLLASVLLGLGYNSLSPLGVRLKSVEAPRPAGAAALAGRLSTSDYFNETLALSLELAPPAVEAGGRRTGGGTLPDAVYPPQPKISWQEVKPLLDTGRCLLVDARTAIAYAAEHIPGALSLPANSQPAELQTFIQKYPKTALIVVYCESPQCPMARKVAAFLAESGFNNLREMSGGFVEYRQVESASSKKAPAK